MCVCRVYAPVYACIYVCICSMCVSICVGVLVFCICVVCSVYAGVCVCVCVCIYQSVACKTFSPLIPLVSVDIVWPNERREHLGDNAGRLYTILQHLLIWIMFTTSEGHRTLIKGNGKGNERAWIGAVMLIVLVCKLSYCMLKRTYAGTYAHTHTQTSTSTNILRTNRHTHLKNVQQPKLGVIFGLREYMPYLLLLQRKVRFICLFHFWCITFFSL